MSMMYEQKSIRQNMDKRTKRIDKAGKARRMLRRLESDAGDVSIPVSMSSDSFDEGRNEIDSVDRTLGDLNNSLVSLAVIQSRGRTNLLPGGSVSISQIRAENESEIRSESFRSIRFEIETTRKTFVSQPGNGDSTSSD